MEPPEAVKKLATDLGGHVEFCAELPDGSGAATMSMPLPKGHWIYDLGPNVPPMQLRMGTVSVQRRWWEQAITEAGRYAVRAATMNGKNQDFDPDALIQNLVVGLLGYHTPDALDHEDAWANPDPLPPRVLSVEFRCARETPEG